MNGDRSGSRAIAGAVLFVAAIAAVTSFIHIEHLAVTHGQTPLAAALLPFSIDGTVVASSLVLLRAARHLLRAPWLAQVMLLSSVLATLAANVAYGAAAGVTGALISGWPAYAFIGCAEMAIMMVRRTTRSAPADVSDGGSHRYKAPPQRKIMAEVGVGQDKARRFQRLLVSEVKAASNGAPTSGGRDAPTPLTVPATLNGSRQ